MTASVGSNGTRPNILMSVGWKRRRRNRVVCGSKQREKQKIAIVRTIIKGGCVLIFDEPTSALDTLTRDRFLAYLQNHKKNKMVIIVSHDITLLQQLDEVVRMEGTTFE